MPWPKGKPHSPAMILKRVETLQTNGTRRKKPKAVGGAVLWRCGSCRGWRVAGEFHPDKRTPNGLRSQCRECHQRGAIKSRNPATHRASRRRAEATRRARKAGSGGTVTATDLETLQALLGAACLKCGSDAEVQWDHVVPLARGGAHHVCNLQPLCRTCNERKQARTADHRTPDQKKAVLVWVVEVNCVEVSNG